MYLNYFITIFIGIIHGYLFSSFWFNWLIEIVIFSIFYFLLSKSNNCKEAAFIGFLFSFSTLITGIWWIYIAIHYYGKSSILFSCILLILFILYLSIYSSIASYIWMFFISYNKKKYNYFYNLKLYDSFIFASSWTICEWLRGTIFTGFPWLSIGYTQVDGPLSGFATIFGIYGISYILALISGLIIQIISKIIFIKNNIKKNIFNIKLYFNKILYLLYILIIIFIFGFLCSYINWTIPIKEKLSIRLLQGNIDQERKFKKKYILESIDKFKSMIIQKAADIIIIPETSIPISIDKIPKNFLNILCNFSNITKSTIIFGAIGSVNNILDNNDKLYVTNSLFGIIPKLKKFYRYDKNHLVPFGEFIPFGFNWIVKLLHIPFVNFISGNIKNNSLVILNNSVMVSICYENIFGEEISKRLFNSMPSANILVNLSNLAWFGNTIALNQHLQISRMRAIENGRIVLLVANTGYTAIINYDGKVLSFLPTNITGSINSNIQGMSGFTPYTKYGNNTILVISLFLFIFIFLYRKI